MNHTGCQFRDKHTVGGIVFYKHAFLVSLSSDPGSMPGGGARGQNLGHLENVLFT